MRDKWLAKLLHRTSHLGTGGTGKALGKHGVKVSERAESTDDLDTLDEAIDLLERVLDTKRQRGPDRAVYLFTLGNALRDRFGRTGALGDLDRAVEVGEQAVAAIPEDHPDRAACLSTLGLALAYRFGRTGRLDDVDRAVEVGEQAVAAIPEDHPDRAVYLSNLGNVLTYRFGRTGALDDVNRAVEVGEQAVAAIPEDHPDRPRCLSNLGLALWDRFGRTGTLDDVDRAVEVGEQAVAAIPEDHPDRAAYLSNLGLALRDRFERTGALDDLDRAVEVGEQAVAAIPEDHPDRPRCLSNLGLALRDRFGRTGTLDDVDRAVEVGEQAVAAIPEDHPDRAAYLSNLGNALAYRFGQTGTLDDVDRAVEVGEQAVAATLEDHPDRATYLSNLGLALTYRFGRTGTLDDLDRAVEVYEQAVAATPEDHPDRAVHLSNLGSALRDRFERTGTLDDLNRAVEVGEQAVAATPEDHPNRAAYLSNLGNALRDRFERTGALDDLDRAVEVYEQAVAAIPEDHPDRPRYLSNLGLALRDRCRRTGRLGDLDRAVEVGEQAVAAIPEDHPDRAAYLFNLGLALRDRFGRTGRLDDLDRALEVLQKATGVVSAPVDERADAAREWGRLAVAAERWAEGVEGFGAAVGLADLVAARGLGRADQEFRLGQQTGLGPDAAAACVQAGKPGRAVELFEQGRGMLFSHVLDAHADLTDLQEAHPELAAQFARWRDELDRPDPRSSGPSASNDDVGKVARLAADRRRKAAAEFDRVLKEIHALPDFKRFLAARPVEELLPAAAGGPVVLLNVAPLRSDVLILTTAGIEVLPLPSINPDGVARQVNTFLDALTEIRDRATSAAVRTAAEARLGGVLAWLWEEITGPVLAHLGHTTDLSEDANWPRLWWCPSGALALLPLHAAGHHDLSGERTGAVIDRVISSTIPTVRALLHARQGPQHSELKRRVLVVAMPHTPGHADLPGAGQEADTLQHLLAGQVDVLGLHEAPPATYETVTAALPGHAWVHFSCHGQSNLADPSASQLLLTDYQTRPLTVMDLTRARLEGVELAFLSACTTAQTGTTLPDEPIHLAAACQLAGYRHVIATLWPISDADTASLTESFYTELTTTPASNAATALHNATRELRAINRTYPSDWAPYIHTGP